MKKSLLLLLPLLFPAGAAEAQPRQFNCIGAERLEDDVFEVRFAQGSARPNDAARTPVAAAAALAKAEPGRNICVLGHAVREGGQTTSTQLAARRAREVAELLSVGQGIERDRIRAEARNPGFASRTPNREARSVTIVVLPSLPGAEAPPAARPASPAPAPAAPQRPAAPATPRAPAPEVPPPAPPAPPRGAAPDSPAAPAAPQTAPQAPSQPAPAQPAPVSPGALPAPPPPAPPRDAPAAPRPQGGATPEAPAQPVVPPPVPAPEAPAAAPETAPAR